METGRDNLRVLAARYTEAWCSQDPARVAQFFSPGGSLTINDGDPAVGRAAITDVARSFMSAFPDLCVVMDDLVLKGDQAEYHWTLTGTNTGPGGTGNKVRISGREEWEFDDTGLLAASKGHFDADEYRRQLEDPACSDDLQTEAFAPAFLFDLDGTLVDSVYQHVLAWREALEQTGMHLAVWSIHRRIGMSGGLLVNALLRETNREITAEDAEHLQRLHAEAYARQVPTVRPLPGARELLAHLWKARVPFAIATSGRIESAGRVLKLLELPPEVPIVTRDQVRYAKPDPHLFLAAARRLGVRIENSVVVGDSVWDLLAARRARALGIGLLSGGYGQEELERAGAYRVYQDPLDLLSHLDEVGVRTLPERPRRETGSGTAIA